MPNTPLHSWEEFAKLKKLKGVLDRRVELYVSHKDIKRQLDEINRPLFEKLSTILPEGVKSVDYSGYQITPQQGEPKRSFKRERLLKAAFKCPHCGENVTTPVKTLDRAYENGKLPKPTVAVREMKTGTGAGTGAGSGADEDDE